MKDKDNINDDKFMRVVKGEEPLKEKPYRKSDGGGVIATRGNRKDIAKIMQDLDKEVEEKSKDLPCDILIERDEFGKVKFILKEKVGVTKDGSIGKIRVGKGFDKNSPACEYSQKITCPVYSELDTNYENCEKYKAGENCLYAEGGEFFRKS